MSFIRMRGQYCKVNPHQNLIQLVMHKDYCIDYNPKTCADYEEQDFQTRRISK